MRGLWTSKRGAFCVIVLALAFALVLVGYLQGVEWASLAKWITAIVVTGHTLTGATETITKRQAAQPAPGVPS